MSFPYLAKSTIKYKSPHATDLSFAKDEKIRVTGPSDDDEDWLVGESLDGSRSGGFPKDFVTPIEEEDEAPVEQAAISPAAAPAPASELVTETPKDSAPPVPADEPPPPSPRLEPSSLPQSPLPVPSPAPSQPPSAISTKPPTSIPEPAPAPRSPAPSAAPEGDAPDPSQMTMKDRLAFFAAAQGKAGPPPPIKPKPATGGLTWSQRQKLRQEEDAKAQQSGTTSDAPAPAPAPTAVSAGTPAAETPTGAQALSSSPKQGKKEGTGMSAADAQTSIGKGGSLKERMAALQGAGAFGQSEESTKPATPAPSGKVWKRPPAPERNPESDEEEDTVRSPTAEEGDGLAEAGGEDEEKTEEEEERAKKAAIAARMAKLGSRGPMAMALPPKPARKPTREAVPSVSPTTEKSPAEAEVSAVAEPETAAPRSPTTSTSPPTSVPMPAIARRTAPPRRRGPPSSTAVPTLSSTTAEKDESLSIGPNNGHEPPPQVMVYNEEKPLPKTEEQKAQEKEFEEAGSKHGGAEGAAAAGIALAPVPGQGSNDSDNEAQDQGAEGSELGLTSPVKQPEMVPLHSPAESPMIDDAETPPPPPPRMAMSDLPKDEIEMKHQQEAEAEMERGDNEEEEEVEEDEDEAPPPPQRDVRRSIGGGEKPLGPRPLPSPGNVAIAPPLPPMGNHMVPPRDDSEDEGEAEDEEEEAPPPPPPARKPSVPVPARLQMPSADSPSAQSPASPKMMQSPVPDSPRSPMRAPPLSPTEEAVPEGEEDEATRRSGIAARMAKLGGVKFGAPPIPKTKRTMSTMSNEPSSAIDETPKSPIREVPPAPQEDDEATAEAVTAPAAGGGDDGDETPEQEAARRRATLARLRAGGSLGFGMFGQRGSTNTPAAADTDERGLETQSEQLEEDVPPVPASRPVPPPQQAPSEIDAADDEGAEEDETDAPPPPPARPGGTHSRSATAQSADFAAPPPPSRAVPPPITTGRDEMEEGYDAPPPPPRPAQSPSVPQSPMGRPSAPPPDRRSSQMLARSSMDQPSVPPPPPPIERQMTEEPADFAPPPPARPPVQSQMSMQSPPASPRRSTSVASRSSGQPAKPPASRQGSRMDDSQPPRSSVSQNRPGFNELQEASKVHGAQLIRAAKAMFSQGKQGNFGDGSPAGFVLTALDNAHLPRPQESWGYIILEQEASSVLKRSDEPRPGDIAAFYDAKLKGKKGLSSYTQNVGSVEEPLVGIVSESETKKHKLRVLQVERGVPEEVSYRCDDLKSGRVVVYRPGV